MATPTTAKEQIEVSAAPEDVYDLVGDLTRMGEWSPECYRVEWLGGATGPAVGVQFNGHNRMGPYRWSVPGKIVIADPGRKFAFTTYVRDRESTRWCYQFEATESGTLLTETYEFIWATPLIRVGDVLMPRRWMLRNGMRHTLQRIKAAAEAR